MKTARRNRGALLGGLVAWVVVGAAGCVQLQLFGGLPKPLEEKVLLGDAGPKILLLKIDGVISMRRPPSRSLWAGESDGMVSRVREVLDVAREDPEVEALLLRIDSPGGSAAASDAVYGEIRRFKRERGVPVVAYLMGTAASGAYYVAMAADRVVADPTSVSGSIGVVYLGVNFAGLMQKLGVENQTLTSGAHKDAGSPLRRLRASERAHLQSIVDDLHSHFREVVDAGRPGLDAKQVATLSDGRLYSSRQALEAGLVDELGGLEHAVSVTKQRAELEQARVVTYHRPSEYENNLYTRAPVPPRIQLEWPAPFDWLSRPGFYYLWAPGI
jgi:protease-4